MMLGSHKVLEPPVRILYRNLPVRQYCNGNPLQHGAKGQQDQCGAYVEDCMDIGDLRHRVARGQACHEIRKRGKDTQDYKQRGSNHIEHQMDDRCPLGIPACSHTCQKRRDTGTDVLSEEHEHRTVDINHPAHGQGLKDAHGR